MSLKTDTQTKTAIAPLETGGAIKETPPGLLSTVIERESGFRPVNLRELWQYRELIWLLAARDLKTRYRQSLLGIAWSLMQPLFTLFVFVAFFSVLGRTPTTSGVPFVVSLLCGIVPWHLFAAILNSTANSLSRNLDLMNKIYCPRLVFSLAPIIPASVDFAASLVVLAAVLAYYRILPPFQLLTLPLFVAMATVVGFTAGLWMAVLSVRWRDIRFMIPVLLQMGFFASPVIYEASALIPEHLRPFYYLNPMAGVLQGFRWCLFGDPGFGWKMFAISGPTTVSLLAVVLHLFRRVERTLPDHL